MPTFLPKVARPHLPLHGGRGAVQLFDEQRVPRSGSACRVAVAFFSLGGCTEFEPASRARYGVPGCVSPPLLGRLGGFITPL